MMDLSRSFITQPAAEGVCIVAISGDEDEVVSIGDVAVGIVIGEMASVAAAEEVGDVAVTEIIEVTEATGAEIAVRVDHQHNPAGGSSEDSCSTLRATRTECTAAGTSTKSMRLEIR